MAQLCRLCLEASDDSVNVFEKFKNSTVASILAKHFWFQIHENDGMSEWLCQICWIQTKTFHHFYKRIEFRHGNYSRPNVLVSADDIKKERSESPMEPDLNIVKSEKIEPTLEAFDSQETKVENTEYDKDYDDDRSENSQATDDEEQPFSNSEPTSHYSLSTSETEVNDAQIREFFTMKCELCSDIEFGTLIEARKHYRSVHKTRGYLICCGKKFKYRDRISDHIRYHINPDAIRCDQCGRSFDDRHALKSHIDNHVPPELRAYKCNLCASSFTKATSLKYHVQQKHFTDTGEKFPCEKCNKNFRSKYSLATHIRGVHEFSLEHVCEICARRFKTKQLLQNHTACEHPAIPQPKVQCNICGDWLKHELGLRKHLKRHGRHEGDFVDCRNKLNKIQ